MRRGTGFRRLGAAQEKGRKFEGRFAFPKCSGGWNQSQRHALVSVRKTGILPRVMQSKTGMAQPRPSAGGAGLFLDPNMALGRAKNPPNVPHQYFDRHRYPSDALRRYSVPDARKRPFSYLQTTLPPRPANAEPHFLLDVRRRGA